MTATKRLWKARKRLDLMRGIHSRLGEPEMREEFLDWTEDCLIALRSVRDHLLQDYNERFNLGIQLEDWMNHRTFRRVAESQSNSEALTFESWLRAEVEAIENDAVFGPLIRLRHLTIHRTDPSLTGNVGITETIRVTDSVHIEILRADGTGESFKPEQPVTSPAELPSTQVQTYWSFDCVPDIDVLEACERLYARLERLVQEAENQFPRAHGEE